MKSFILLTPLITEKTSAQLEVSKYTFLVHDEMNKIELKKEIEKRYSVNVEEINISKKLGKKKRRGRIVGRTVDQKKAIVTLKEGQSIDALKEVI